MKGFVPTPPAIVDLMVDKLFAGVAPDPNARLLDPGCGPGAFIEGVLRWCSANGTAPPHILGVDSDARHVDSARHKFRGEQKVQVRNVDFLLHSDSESFDYVVGNPPYVSITGLSVEERADYRSRYATATNRFDLYALFFERALQQLAPSGSLVFITPEKFLYVESATSLRSVLSSRRVEELHFLAEDTFGDLVTYPLVTTIRGGQTELCSIRTRDGERRCVQLPTNGSSWLPAVMAAEQHHGPTLSDIALRISCGVATGSDREFVVPDRELASPLRRFSYPTISGRQLIPGHDPIAVDRLLVPYDRSGNLIAESSLGALGAYLRDERRKSVLMDRTCTKRKPWYSFHENPPLNDILGPKILCKDVSSAPHFFVDRTGSIVPRHSVYYIVPRDPATLEQLSAYLNSETARAWLMKHCQRAAGGFIRLQSHVLKRLPVPDTLKGAHPPIRSRPASQLDLGATTTNGFRPADAR